MIMLPLVASAHDIEVPNADGVTIYYNYINDGTELAVTFRGKTDDSYPDRYTGNVVIPEEVTYMNRTRKVTYIWHYAFRECKGLTSVTIPNSVTKIGTGAFIGCLSLASATIPNSVTSIENNAFYHCPNLTSFTIPNSVTNIGDNAFTGCTSLTSITIPNSVTRIGFHAFRNCTGLTSISIPNSVTSIGYGAFDGIDFPYVVSLIENPFEIYGNIQDKRTFSINTFYNATLYVPKGTIDKYKATEGWKDFLFIEEGTGGGGTTLEKCKKPTIGYANGKLTFACSTEGATCHYSISDSDIKAGSGSEVQLGVTYNIRVYATKSGYDNSDVATATLCWIDASPKTEGITNGVAQIAARPVLVKTDNGFITVEGADDRTNVSIYTTDGKQVGSTISQNNIATIATSIQPGSIAIVKVGDKAVKVIMK